MSITASSFAQSTDSGLWPYIGIKKNFPRKFSLAAEGEIRTRSGISQLECWAITTDATYSPCKNLQAGLGYVYIESNTSEQELKPKHRFYIYATGSYTANKWSFALRTRYQQTHSPSVDGAPVKHIFRPRLQVSFNAHEARTTPYITLEPYIYICDKEKRILEKTRFTAGLKIGCTKSSALYIYYRYILFAQKINKDSHILGLGYYITLTNE